MNLSGAELQSSCLLHLAVECLTTAIPLCSSSDVSAGPLVSGKGPDWNGIEFTLWLMGIFQALLLMVSLLFSIAFGQSPVGL